MGRVLARGPPTVPDEHVGLPRHADLEGARSADQVHRVTQWHQRLHGAGARGPDGFVLLVAVDERSGDVGHTLESVAVDGLGENHRRPVLHRREIEVETGCEGIGEYHETLETSLSVELAHGVHGEHTILPCLVDGTREPHLSILTDLLVGESDQIVAQAIERCPNRMDHTFVTVDVAGHPEDGHVHEVVGPQLTQGDTRIDGLGRNCDHLLGHVHHTVTGGKHGSREHVPELVIDVLSDHVGVDEDGDRTVVFLEAGERGTHAVGRRDRQGIALERRVGDVELGVHAIGVAADVALGHSELFGDLHTHLYLESREDVALRLGRLGHLRRLVDDEALSLTQDPFRRSDGSHDPLLLQVLLRGTQGTLELALVRAARGLDALGRLTTSEHHGQVTRGAIGGGTGTTASTGENSTEDKRHDVAHVNYLLEPVNPVSGKVVENRHIVNPQEIIFYIKRRAEAQ